MVCPQAAGNAMAMIVRQWRATIDQRADTGLTPVRLDGADAA
jgi:hypothetical protein